MKVAIALSALVIATGCARIDAPRSEPRAMSTITSEPGSHDAPSAASAGSAVEPLALPGLEAPALERLDLESGHHAYVALPTGARDKRVVVVGVHGAGDRADWACSEWQAVTAGWAIVVCPEGVAHPTAKNTFVWGSAEAIASQADEAVRALKAKYGAWVQDGPLIYGGWSQGGTLAAQVVASRPAVYDRVVMVEVGHTPLDAAQVANGFVAGGIMRAVVVCESWNCRTFAQTFERAAKRRQLTVRVNDVGLRPHWFDEPVFRSLGPSFVWMVEDHPRFAGLGAAVDARFSTD